MKFKSIFFCLATLFIGVSLLTWFFATRITQCQLKAVQKFEYPIAWRNESVVDIIHGKEVNIILSVVVINASIIEYVNNDIKGSRPLSLA